ncbi:MAG: DUF3037 domain-containing protein [Saprospiraceae bacterium]
MSNKVSYEYAIIRVVPKVEREEFINVGVILYSKRKKFLDLKYQVEADRLKAFAPDLDLALIRSYLKAWDLICQGGKAGGPIGQLEIQVRFRWLTANRSTIIQSSAVHPGLCDQPEKVLEQLFEEYVL